MFKQGQAYSPLWDAACFAITFIFSIMTFLAEDFLGFITQTSPLRGTRACVAECKKSLFLRYVHSTIQPDEHSFEKVRNGFMGPFIVWKWNLFYRVLWLVLLSTPHYPALPVKLLLNVLWKLSWKCTKKTCIYVYKYGYVCAYMYFLVHPSRLSTPVSLT